MHNAISSFCQYTYGKTEKDILSSWKMKFCASPVCGVWCVMCDVCVCMHVWYVWCVYLHMQHTGRVQKRVLIPTPPPPLQLELQDPSVTGGIFGCFSFLVIVNPTILG